MKGPDHVEESGGFAGSAKVASKGESHTCGEDTVAECRAKNNRSTSRRSINKGGLRQRLIPTNWSSATRGCPFSSPRELFACTWSLEVHSPR